MKNQIVIAPDASAETEALLQGLIAECHQIIHDVVRPAIPLAEDDSERRRFLASVVELVRVGAEVGDTIARLQGGAAQETRQRITVERIETTGGQALPKGRGV